MFFNYYKNPHLILKLKLPVKYIGLSVGDLVKFEELLGGINAYGIDYTKVQWLPDSNKIYPLFYITSLHKDVNSVSVEMIQLHDLVDGYSEEISGYQDLDEPDLIFDENSTLEGISGYGRAFKFPDFDGENSLTITTVEGYSVLLQDAPEEFKNLFGVSRWYRQDTPDIEDTVPINDFLDLIDSTGTGMVQIFQFGEYNPLDNTFVSKGNIMWNSPFLPDVFSLYMPEDWTITTDTIVYIKICFG